MKPNLIILFGYIALQCLLTSCSSGQDSTTAQTPVETGNVATKTCLNQWDTNSEWSNEQEVVIPGYSQSAMEPKVAADGGVLFWNDKPTGGDSLMNIHYAVKQSDQSWLYIGTVPGTVDNSNLDGVPAIDSASVGSVASSDSAVKNTQSGYLDMDIDISWDGSLMIVSRALFAGNAYPETSELKLFNVASRQASTLSNSAEILANVNSSLCRTYAGTLSNDKKELYFTVFPTTTTAGSDFRILVAKRNSTTEPFGKPQVISAITSSYMEGPSLTQDGRKLYYHKFDSTTGRFKIFQVSR